MKITKFELKQIIKEELLKEVWLPKLTSMWIVSQKDHEYNPIHMHSDNISAIMYLKIPEYLQREHSLIYTTTNTESEHYTSVDDKVHEMFIVHNEQTFVIPHSHKTKSESFFII